jgi:type I restriction enzyme, S subunit
MSDLPTRWTATTLGEIASQGQYGWTSKAAENGQVKYLRTTDITSGHIDWDTVPFCQDDPPDVEKYRIELGDILISRAGSVGFSALIQDIPTTPAVFASYLIRYIPKSEVNPKYIAHFLKSPNYWQQISAAASGIALANVNAKKLANVILPLAPLGEQKRIVKKLDRLLIHLDSCQSHLERVPQILKRFRQSVLASATSGRLTEDWRAEDHTISGEFGDFEFPDLPSTWKLLPIKEIGQVKGGKRLPNGEKLVDYDTGLPYIRAGQLKKGTVIAEDQLYLLPSTQKKISRYIVNAGDVYITIVGASIGDAGVIPQNYDKVNLTENAAKICQLSGIEGNYLALWLRSPYAQDIIKSLIKSGAQGKLALTRINEIPVPLPPLEEQAEITQRIEKLFAYAERLEARYLSAKERIKQLTPSLLAKAFRGDLVKQDPNDEPASVLLERIRAAKDNSSKEVKKTREGSVMNSMRAPKVTERKSVVQALQDAGQELSSEQLFTAAGYPSDAESELVEEFFVEVRDAILSKQIRRKRRNNLDWFSLSG